MWRIRKVTFCLSCVSWLIDGLGCHFLRKGTWHEVGAGARGALSFGFLKREELELLRDKADQTMPDCQRQTAGG